MVAPGTHKARAVSHGLGETSKGLPQVAVEFEILEGENAGEHITWFGSFSDNALHITVKALRACGWQGVDVSEIGDLNNEVAIVVDQEEYEGKIRTKVKWVNEPGGVALKSQMDPLKAKAFAQKMKSTIMAIDGGGARKTAQHPAHATPPPPSDADMPEWAR